LGANLDIELSWLTDIVNMGFGAGKLALYAGITLIIFDACQCDVLHCVAGLLLEVEGRTDKDVNLAGSNELSTRSSFRNMHPISAQNPRAAN
jgi:hypothetical protein